MLAGLVSITANCSVVNPWHAVIIGLIGSIILFLGHYLLFKLKIDDPCDAAVRLCLPPSHHPPPLLAHAHHAPVTRTRPNAQVVHGFCGYWGLLATGIFCTDVNVQYAAYPNVNDACRTGEQFGVQVTLSPRPGPQTRAPSP